MRKEEAEEAGEVEAGKQIELNPLEKRKLEGHSITSSVLIIEIPFYSFFFYDYIKFIKDIPKNI